MKTLHFVSISLLAASLAACSGKPASNVRITSQKPVAPQSHSEQVSYNNKPYSFSMAPNGASYDIAISSKTAPMTDKNEKDARNITLSSVRYFACKDPKVTKIDGKPSFDGGTWRLKAHCT